MESAPFWLPPLDSHEKYTTTISVAQPQEAWTAEEYLEKYFLIHVFFEATFSSQSKLFPHKGLLLRQSFLSSATMTYYSQEQMKRYMSNMFDFLHIPFELGNVDITQCRFDRANMTTKRLMSCEDADSWVVKFQEFLRYMESCNGPDHNVLPVNLRIATNIEISSDEFETWLSWFREKYKVDPSFLLTYYQAIRRPRTIQELLDAKDRKGRGLEKSSLAALQDANLTDESASQQCMVCLEELSDFGICRLPCSHIFHKNCITKWLEGRNMCPLCRSPLHSDQWIDN